MLLQLGYCKEFERLLSCCGRTRVYEALCVCVSKCVRVRLVSGTGASDEAETRLGSLGTWAGPMMRGRRVRWVGVAIAEGRSDNSLCARNM